MHFLFGPDTVADGLPGQVYDRVGAAEIVAYDPPVRVPEGLIPRCRVMAHQPRDIVALGAEERDEVPADEAAGAGHGDLQGWPPFPEGGVMESDLVAVGEHPVDLSADVPANEEPGERVDPEAILYPVFQEACAAAAGYEEVLVAPGGEGAPHLDIGELPARHDIAVARRPSYLRRADGEEKGCDRTLADSAFFNDLDPFPGRRKAPERAGAAMPAVEGVGGHGEGAALDVQFAARHRLLRFPDEVGKGLPDGGKAEREFLLLQARRQRLLPFKKETAEFTHGHLQ